MLYPAIYTKPLSPDFPSDGDRLLELVRLAWRTTEQPDGIVLDEWQEWLIRAILERYPADHPDPGKAGRLRYRQVCVSVPRQSGKSLLGAIIAGAYGLLMHMPKGGAQVLSLASSREQAEIIYSRVLYVIRENLSLAKRFRKATERRGIVTADGRGRYDVKPAKESALQGIPISLCLFDELHLARRGNWSAAVLGTSQFEDGIVIGITTAGDDNSETLIDLYRNGERAANGDPELERFGFFAWQAPDGADVKDPNAILASNPAVECGRIPIDRVMSDLATLPEHEARRYRLNQFISGVTNTWLPADLFHAAAGDPVKNMTGAVLGVDITAKWEYATIAAANTEGDIVQTELVASFAEPSEIQLYNHIVALYRKHKIRAIVIDGQRAPNLAKKLKVNGFVIWQLYSKEVSAACSQGFAAFSTNKITHHNDPLLVAQYGRAVAKYVDESWFLSRRLSNGDIDAVMATLFAHYGAMTTRQDSSIGVF